jgi:hypothetical protein
MPPPFEHPICKNCDHRETCNNKSAQVCEDEERERAYDEMEAHRVARYDLWMNDDGSV